MRAAGIRRTLVALAMGAGLMTSCDSIFGSDPCSTDVQPTFDKGRDLEISWGSCSVNALVVRSHQNNALWTLTGEFESPVLYGIIPSGGSEPSGPAYPLIPGAQYKLFLGVSEGGEVVMVGPFDFTR